MDVLSLIDDIYDAAVYPENWPRLLRTLQQTFRGAGALLYGVDREQRVPFMMNVDLPDESLREYREHYIKQCPKLGYLERNPAERHVYDYKFIEESAIDTDEYYEWLRRSTGTRYFIGSRLYREADYEVFVGIQRTRNVGHVDDDEIALYSSLAAHLERAAHVMCRFGLAQERARGAEAALDIAPVATVLLDAQGRVTYANARAEDLLASADGLSAGGDGIHARAAVDDDRLQKAVARALELRARDAGQAQDVVAIARPSGARSYVLRIVPLRSPSADWRALAGAKLAIFITDPQSDVKIASLPLQALYGLTPTEVRVATCLSAGLATQEIANSLGITRNTARLHVERILQKTGTHRRSELVGLLHSMCGAG